MKHFLPVLTLLLLFTVESSFAVRKQKDIQTYNTIKKESARLGMVVDSLTALRWQNKYRETEYRKQIQERDKELAIDYNKILVEKNILEEKVLRLRQEIEQEKENLIQKKERYQAFREFASRSLENYSQTSYFTNPVNINVRIKKINQLKNAIKTEKITSFVDMLFNMRIHKIKLAESQSFSDVTVMDSIGNTYNALRLRLGNIQYSDIGKDNSRVRLLLNTGNIKGKTFVWRYDLGLNIKNILIKSLNSIAKDTSLKELMIPLDVLRSKTLFQNLSSNHNNYSYEKIWVFLKQGGPVMIPLGFIALLSFMMIIERLIYYRRKNTNSKKLMEMLDPVLNSGEMGLMLEKCKFARDTSLGRALYSIVEKAANKETRTNAENALHEAILNEMPELEKGLSTIAVFGSVAPLLGLLGTVAGMISLFEIITSYGTSDPKLLAGGISEALVTTEVGLIIAIPIILMHNYLSGKTNYIINEINRLGMTLLNRIWPEK